MFVPTPPDVPALQLTTLSSLISCFHSCLLSKHSSTYFIVLAFDLYNEYTIPELRNFDPGYVICIFESDLQRLYKIYILLCSEITVSIILKLREDSTK